MKQFRSAVRMSAAKNRAVEPATLYLDLVSDLSDVPFSAALAQVRPLQTALQTPAPIRGMEGALLELNWSVDSLAPGTLVEVSTSTKLYLGEVEFCQQGILRIRCDHSLDLGLLKEIRSRWNLSSESAAPALPN